MNFTFLPSLEHIVLVKIATSLWNQSDIRALIVKFHLFGENREDSIILEDIELKIKEKVLLLNYPSSLKEKILCVIKPIGLQIDRWMKFSKKTTYLGVYLPDEFSWTPHGTIDRKKTAEALMTDETIHIIERYELACIYCLKNYVGALWEEMSENHRAYFYMLPQHDLVVIWTYDIKGEMAKLRRRRFQDVEMTETSTPNQYPFKCAFIHGNKVAAEYFWSKLSLDDREDSLRFMVNWDFRRFDDFDFFDMLLFTLPRMNKDQQKALFEKYPRDLLEYFLELPWQSLLMDMTNHVNLDKEDYWMFLHMIVYKVDDGYKDYDYQKLLGEFWQKSTEDYKKYVIDFFCVGGYMLPCLFRNKDIKNISLILKDASVLEKAAMFDNIGIGREISTEKNRQEKNRREKYRRNSL